MDKNTMAKFKVLAKRAANTIKENPGLINPAKDLIEGEIALSVAEALLEDYKAGKIELTDEQKDRVLTKYSNNLIKLLRLSKSEQA